MAFSQSPSNVNDLRRLVSLVPYITGDLQDGSRIGTFYVCLNRSTSSANTDVVIAHNLGRVPNGYIVFRSALGGVVYDGSVGRAAWTGTQVVVRDTVANDTISFLLV